MENKIYFGRDRIGRRSLIISPPINKIDSSEYFLISSVMDYRLGECEEINPNNLYCYNIENNKIDIIQWKSSIPHEIIIDKPYPILLFEYLYNAVYKRVYSIPFRKAINTTIKPARYYIIF